MNLLFLLFSLTNKEGKKNTIEELYSNAIVLCENRDELSNLK